MIVEKLGVIFMTKVYGLNLQLAAPKASYFSICNNLLNELVCNEFT